MIHPRRDQVLYIINCVFFHSAAEIGLSEEDIPAHPALQDSQMAYPFMSAGIIGRDETCAMEGVLAGSLLDEFGVSELFDVTLNLEAGTLDFTKVYVDRPEVSIFYHYKRCEFGMWIGNYSGDGGSVKPGFTRCMLTPVSPDFFLPFFFL